MIYPSFVEADTWVGRNDLVFVFGIFLKYWFHLPKKPYHYDEHKDWKTLTNILGICANSS